MTFKTKLSADTVKVSDPTIDIKFDPCVSRTSMRWVIFMDIVA
jgi:hypothetical protein